MARQLNKERAQAAASRGELPPSSMPCERASLRIILQAESCPSKLEMPSSSKWLENPGDIAWRRRISRYFYPCSMDS